MSKKKDVRQNIIDYSRNQFLRYGFSHVTTDEIAAQMGISKKTLYKFFPNKEELVKKIADDFVEGFIGAVKSVVWDQKLEFMEKVLRLRRTIIDHYSNISEPFVHDLKRKMPFYYKEMLNKRKETILNITGSIFKEGIRKKIFRKDVDPEIVLLVYLNAIQNIVVPDVLKRLSLSASDLYEMIARIIDEGIMTDFGKKRDSQ